MTHTVKGFGIVNKAEIDVFLELSCFFHHPVDVGNLISGSSAFSKTSLNIWKFMVHVFLKPGLENFEHYPPPTAAAAAAAANLLQSCPTLYDPIDGLLPGSSVPGFSRQEHWSALPFPSPGDLLDPGIESSSSTLQADSLPSESPGTSC